MDEARQIIVAVLQEWHKRTDFTYQEKMIHSGHNPTMAGEALFYFENSVNSFFCQGKLIPIRLMSDPYTTVTLSTPSIADNPLADKYRLEKFLIDFDEKFREMAQRLMDECPEKTTTSDPFFF